GGCCPVLQLQKSACLGLSLKLLSRLQRLSVCPAGAGDERWPACVICSWVQLTEFVLVWEEGLCLPAFLPTSLFSGVFHPLPGSAEEDKLLLFVVAVIWRRKTFQVRWKVTWSQVRNGHIKRITDNDIQSLVLEIEGTNVSTTYITCPADPKKTLGIKLPFLVMIIKNLKKYFTFEVQVLDDKNVRRRFRASNYQSTTRVKPFICTMPMRLDDGWNQIQFNLSDFTRRAYGTNYIETLRVQIHANCRIRRVYFSDRLYSEDELPAEFKLYLPVQNKAKQ
uniref:Cilia and flagella associated protein 20 n=51 Tax=Aves TaxID=8782 RepID=A0A8C3PVB2_CHRPC